MQQSLQLSFRGMASSPAVESRVHELVTQLERFDERITSCHVTIQAPHQHHRKGNLFEVSIQLRIPGKELVIKHEGSQNHAHEDVYVALRDAFDAARRRLEDIARKRDHRARAHEVPPHGRVKQIFPQDEYGFIETADGLDVYFHAHSVVDQGFGKLEVGDEVRLEIADGESNKGPQATTVRRVGKHHVVG